MPHGFLVINIGSGNGLSLVHCRGITSTNADILSIASIEMIFSEIWIKIQNLCEKQYPNAYPNVMCTICQLVMWSVCLPCASFSRGDNNHSMEMPSQYDGTPKEEKETCKPLDPIRRTKAIILFVLVATFSVGIFVCIFLCKCIYMIMITISIDLYVNYYVCRVDGGIPNSCVLGCNVCLHTLRPEQSCWRRHFLLHFLQWECLNIWGIPLTTSQLMVMW